MIDDYAALITQHAAQFQLDPLVIKAVILTESRGDPWSYRVEQNYPWLVNPRDWADKLVITFNSEVQMQSTSIGLMHPMGGVCREHGFDRMLSEIFRPELSLLYGCRHLQKKAQAYGSDPATLYAAYNAGSPRKTPGGMFVNQTNVDRFAKNLASLKA